MYHYCVIFPRDGPEIHPPSLPETWPGKFKERKSYISYFPVIKRIVKKPDVALGKEVALDSCRSRRGIATRSAPAPDTFGELSSVSRSNYFGFLSNRRKQAFGKQSRYRVMKDSVG